MEGLLIELLKNIGIPIAVTIITAILVFKYLASKWIESKFTKSLEDHKHKLENEREKLKFEINSLFNRVTKIHEKEIEVLPIAWKKLDDLLDLLRKFIREHHCINNKSPKELDDFYKESEEVADACLEFQNYITKKGIFLSPDIKNKFKEAERAIRTVWAKRKNAESDNDRYDLITEVCDSIKKDISPIMDEIEKLVQKRLGFPEK
ncbi:MAG: hypothetical protein GF364_00490 [Candidatus Lokiarchaeota archaeon]|nr:hypothetical protein [Candidatus Lokiarchaeota archaeon]